MATHAHQPEHNGDTFRRHCIKVTAPWQKHQEPLS
jgi:hypothetical protein